jgi:hypothetical protein
VLLGEDLADGLVGPPQVRNFVGFWNPWLPLAPDTGDAAVGGSRVLTLQIGDGRIGFHAPAASFENP